MADVDVLTPDLRPFFGGTYWPPSRKMGMPGFDEILMAVADAWRNRRAELTSQADQLTLRLGALGDLPTGDAPLDRAPLEAAEKRLPKSLTRRMEALAAPQNSRIRWICDCY